MRGDNSIGLNKQQTTMQSQQKSPTANDEEDIVTNTHVGADSIAFKFNSQNSSLNLNQSQGTNLANVLKKGHVGLLQSYEETEHDEYEFDDPKEMMSLKLPSQAEA